MNGSQSATKSHFQPDIDRRPSAGTMSTHAEPTACSPLSHRERLGEPTTTVDYANPSNFMAAFKKAYGVSPKLGRG